MASKMKYAKQLKLTLGAICIIAAIVWSIRFPKSADIMRPDFVISVVIGVGLFATGCVLVLSAVRQRVQWLLPTLLIWSLAANLSLGALLNHAVDVANHQHELLVSNESR
jgi:predicted acyltransferase